MVYHPNASEQFKYFEVLNCRCSLLKLYVVSSGSLNYWFLPVFLRKFCLLLGPSISSPLPLYEKPKATDYTKSFNLWNDRKDSPGIKGLTNSHFAEILQHESVDKLRAGCRSKEAIK